MVGKLAKARQKQIATQREFDNKKERQVSQQERREYTKATSTWNCFVIEHHSLAKRSWKGSYSLSKGGVKDIAPVGSPRRGPLIPFLFHFPFFPLLHSMFIGSPLAPRHLEIQF